MSLRKLQLALALALGLAISSPMLAQKTEQVLRGNTRVKTSTQFRTVLSGSRLTVSTIAPATAVASTVTQFPIVTGAIDLDTGGGEVIHSGGWRITNGSVHIKLENLEFENMGGLPTVTALLLGDGVILGRIPIAFVQFTGNISLPLTPGNGTMLAIYGADLYLTQQAASALNTSFTVNSFTGGLYLGHADLLPTLSGPGSVE